MDRTKTALSEWFDIKDKQHLLAYEYLLDKGEWPRFFIPMDVEMEDGWKEKINFKITKTYIEMMARPATRGDCRIPPRVPREFSG